MKQRVRSRRARVIGVYALPYCPDLYALELVIPAAPNQVDFSEFRPYEPPAWDPYWGVGAAHFYLSDDGCELIGSYLGRPAIKDEEERIWSWEYRQRLRT